MTCRLQYSLFVKRYNFFVEKMRGLIKCIFLTLLFLSMIVDLGEGKRGGKVVKKVAKFFKNLIKKKEAHVPPHSRPVIKPPPPPLIKQPAVKNLIRKEVAKKIEQKHLPAKHVSPPPVQKPMPPHVLPPKKPSPAKKQPLAIPVKKPKFPLPPPIIHKIEEVGYRLEDAREPPKFLENVLMTWIDTEVPMEYILSLTAKQLVQKHLRKFIEEAHANDPDDEMLTEGMLQIVLSAIVRDRLKGKKDASLEEYSLMTYSFLQDEFLHHLSSKNAIRRSGKNRARPGSKQISSLRDYLVEAGEDVLERALKATVKYALSQKDRTAIGKRVLQLASLPHEAVKQAFLRAAIQAYLIHAQEHSQHREHGEERQSIRNFLVQHPEYIPAGIFGVTSIPSPDQVIPEEAVEGLLGALKRGQSMHTLLDAKQAEWSMAVKDLTPLLDALSWVIAKVPGARTKMSLGEALDLAEGALAMRAMQSAGRKAEDTLVTSFVEDALRQLRTPTPLHPHPQPLLAMPREGRAQFLHDAIANLHADDPQAQSTLNSRMDDLEKAILTRENREVLEVEARDLAHTILGHVGKWEWYTDHEQQQYLTAFIEFTVKPASRLLSNHPDNGGSAGISISEEYKAALRARTLYHLNLLTRKQDCPGQQWTPADIRLAQGRAGSILKYWRAPPNAAGMSVLDRDAAIQRMIPTGFDLEDASNPRVKTLLLPFIRLIGTRWLKERLEVEEACSGSDHIKSLADAMGRVEVKPETTDYMPIIEKIMKDYHKNRDHEQGHKERHREWLKKGLCRDKTINYLHTLLAERVTEAKMASDALDLLEKARKHSRAALNWLRTLPSNTTPNYNDDEDEHKHHSVEVCEKKRGTWQLDRLDAWIQVNVVGESRLFRQLVLAEAMATLQDQENKAIFQ